MMARVTSQTDMIMHSASSNAAQKDVNEIYLGNLGTVDADLNLPAKGHRDSTFIWNSSDHLYLTDEGHVTRPLPGVGNRHITLTVKARNCNKIAVRNFSVTVIEQVQTSPIISVDDVTVDVMRGMPDRLPTVAIARHANGVTNTIRAIWPKRLVNLSIDQYNNHYVVNGTATDDGHQFPIVAHVKLHDVDPRANNLASARLSRLQMQSLVARLHDGTDFATVAHDVRDFLLSVDDDHILVNFRMAAGLDTHNAPLMTGWDAPDSKLRGHTTGHYLSAFSLAYHTSGDRRFTEKIDDVVSVLAQCQAELHKSQGCAWGFLAAYDEEPFTLLEQGACYPDVWAPYYTQDKILSGLLDAYEFGGNHQALQIGVNMGLWISRRLGRLSPERRAKMWSTYIAGEFGGLGATFVRLYRLSGNPVFIRTATYFRNDKLLYPMVQDVDTLAGMHANQHIPQITGALDLFTYGGDADDNGALPSYSTSFEVAQNFWRIVTSHHLFAQGGLGETEMIRDADKEAAGRSEKSAESCASYSMMKLTAALFAAEHNSCYTNYYAHVLRNHILATFSRNHDGGSTYFFPLQPGGQCVFDVSENTCCHGSGLENPFRYQDMIATEQNIGRDIYINLYVPATLQGQTTALDLTAEGMSLSNPLRSGFRITTTSCGAFTLHLRIPEYASDPRLIIVTASTKNQSVGTTFPARPDKSGYVGVTRTWESGDAVVISWTPAFHVHHCADQPNLVSLAYGPDVLVALSDDRNPPRVNPQEVENALLSNPNNWREQHIVRAAGMNWVPIYRSGGKHFNTYVDITL